MSSVSYRGQPNKLRYFTYNYSARDRAEKRELAQYVSCILWPCGTGLVTEMRCVAFEIDTVKLLMTLFVRKFGTPELCAIYA